MSNDVEIKKSISELEGTDIVKNEDLLLLSRPVGTDGSYNSLNIRVGDFLENSLTDYSNIREWVWNTISALSSEYIDERFVHKVKGDHEEYAYEEIDGGKNFLNTPSCSINPVYLDDLVRYGFLNSNYMLSNDICASFSNILKIIGTHNHDDRYYTKSGIDSKLEGYSLKTHNHDDRYYTESEINTKLDQYIPKHLGRDGDVVYRVTDKSTKAITYKDQKIMTFDAYICQTNEEIEKCKAATPSFKNIYETWTRTATKRNGEWYGFTPGYQVEGTKEGGYEYYGIKAWTYDQSIDSIVQPLNVVDTEGFVSNEKFTDYDIEARLYSTNVDDDFIGIIAGYAIDENFGKPVMLAFERSSRNTWDNAGCYETREQFNSYFKSERWRILKAYPNKNATRIDHSRLLDGSTSEMRLSSTYIEGKIGRNGWTKCNGGVKVRVKREGDMISAWTTPFEENANRATVLSKSYVDPIVFDLRSDTSLSALRNGGSIGYSTYSQPQSKYENIRIDIPRVIIDQRTNEMIRYNTKTGYWDPVTDILAMDYVGYGRICKNNITGKTYYVGDSGFILIASIDEYETWTFTLDNDNTITKNVHISK